jgi:hypothetical protein
MNMHVGQRGGDTMMDHFREVVGSLKQDPSNIHANMDAIREYAQTVLDEGKGKSQQAPPSSSPGGLTIGNTGPGGKKITKITPIQ